MNGINCMKESFLSKETRLVSSGSTLKNLKMENEVINQPAFDKTFVEFCRQVERNKKVLLSLENNTKLGEI